MSVVVSHQRATSFEPVPGEGNNNHVGDQLQKFDESYIPSIERPLARRYSFGKEKQNYLMMIKAAAGHSNYLRFSVTIKSYWMLPRLMPHSHSQQS